MQKTPRRAAKRTPKHARPLAYEPRHALNAVCPYFTMFPLEYPLRVLDPVRLRTFKRPVVCDPYCGRGTSVYAARLRGLPVYGMDVAPVAVAIAQAKLVSCSVDEVMQLYEELYEPHPTVPVPTGAFWRAAFHSRTLAQLCHFRQALSRRTSDAAKLLRAILLGALHGPLSKDPERASYFSNQMPRTFAAKPDYAVRFWKDRGLRPREVNMGGVVRTRATRLLAHPLPTARTPPTAVRCIDSRTPRAYEAIASDKITHVVTSPPYYGLRTYAQDQWLRHWFVGGPEVIDYGSDPGLDHSSPKSFAQSLATVWDQLGDHASERIQLYVRFGGIRSRHACPEAILRESLTNSRHAWRVRHRTPAATADRGKRQALQMTPSTRAIEESDYVITLR